MIPIALNIDKILDSIHTINSIIIFKERITKVVPQWKQFVPQWKRFQSKSIELFLPETVYLPETEDADYIFLVYQYDIHQEQSKLRNMFNCNNASCAIQTMEQILKKQLRKQWSQ